MSLTQTLTPYKQKDLDFRSQSHQIMSITGYQDRAKTYSKKSVHHRNDSDELDVFEAARYFSGYNDISTNYSHTQERIVKEDTQDWRKQRISLEISPMRKTAAPKASLKIEKQVIEKKYNMVPVSPGGKLARFLNSLFSQTGHKTKKSKSSTQSVKDEGEGGRRRRRSSISNFRSSSSTTGYDTKSLYTSSSTASGFRTPPVFLQTTSKNLRSWSDHKQLDLNDHKRNHDLTWLADKEFSFIVGDDHQCSLPKPKKDEPRKFSNGDDDDGAESDTSSDLFELGTCSSGLPVYETTHMNRIKI